MASFLPSPALDVRPASAANNIPDCLSGYTVVSSNHAHEFVLSSVALTDSQNAALQQGDAMATSAGALLSDRPDEDGPLVLTIPGDISRKAVEAVIVAHQDTPIEAPTSRRDRARAALAAIDRTKITGEAAKLITVLDELVSD